MRISRTVRGNRRPPPAELWDCGLSGRGEEDFGLFAVGEESAFIGVFKGGCQQLVVRGRGSVTFLLRGLRVPRSEPVLDLIGDWGQALRGERIRANHYSPLQGTLRFRSCLCDPLRPRRLNGVVGSQQPAVGWGASRSNKANGRIGPIGRMGLMSGARVPTFLPSHLLAFKRVRQCHGATKSSSGELGRSLPLTVKPGVMALRV